MESFSRALIKRSPDRSAPASARNPIPGSHRSVWESAVRWGFSKPREKRAPFTCRQAEDTVALLPPDHRRHQMAELGVQIRTATGVNGRGLHHRTSRGNQPMKALPDAQPADGAGIRAAGADCGYGRERAPDQ